MADSFFPAPQQVGSTPEGVKRKKTIAEAMMEQGMATTPVQHWTQALARVLQGGMGGWLDHKADEEERAGTAGAMSNIVAEMQKMYGGGGDTANQPAAGAATADSGPSGASMGFATRQQREGHYSAAPYQGAFADTEKKYALPAGYLNTTAGIESSYNPNAQNPNSSAGGLFQFIDSTAQRVGLKNKFDPSEATDAAGRLAAANKAQLTKTLGREPTAGELYMAHQQGAGKGGAASILTADPNAPIASVIGAHKANINGGRGLTVAQFRQQYEGRFGTPQPTQAAATPPVPPGGAPAPEQDAQNAPAQAQGTMQPAPVKRVAQAIGGATPAVGSPGYFQSIVDNPRSPAPQREWAAGELAKAAGGQQQPQAQPGGVMRGNAQPAMDPSAAAGQQPIPTPPGYTPQQVAAAQAAAAQGQQRFAQGRAQKADEIAAGAGANDYVIPGTGQRIPANNGNATNPAQATPPPAPPQSAPSPAQQQVAQAVQQASPAQRQNVSPGLIKALVDPWTPKGMHSVLGALLQKQLEGDKTQYHYTTDGQVYAQRGNAVPKLVMQIPKDPVAAAKADADLANAQAQARGAPQIERERQLKIQQQERDLGVGGPTAVGGMEPPPGADIPTWRKEATQRSFDASAPAKSEDVSSLRKEIQQLPSYKNISQAAPIYRNMEKTVGSNSRASDLNLVYSLGKIFDPNSVVREGEMVMVKNTASLPEWFQGAVDTLNGGAAMTPATRKQVMAEAHNRIQSYHELFQQDAEQYRGIAGRRKMNEADVIPSFGEFKPWQPAQAPAGGNANQPAAPITPRPSGTVKGMKWSVQ